MANFGDGGQFSSLFAANLCDGHRVTIKVSEINHVRRGLYGLPLLVDFPLGIHHDEEIRESADRLRGPEKKNAIWVSGSNERGL